MFVNALIVGLGGAIGSIVRFLTNELLWNNLFEDVSKLVLTRNGDGIDLNFEDPNSPPMVFINPEIISSSATLDTYEEGCLSIPGVYLNVLRPSSIKLSYRDEMGRPKKMNADGLMARCIQHEIDHLNGVCFVDKVTDEEELKKQLNENNFKRSDVIKETN